MPEEVVPIVVIAILSFTGLSIFLIHTISSFMREKEGIGKNKRKQKTLENSGTSLTTSELEMMLRKVVEEANAPLTERIEALEDQLDIEPLAELPEARKSLNDELLEEGPRDLAAISRSRRRIEE